MKLCFFPSSQGGSAMTQINPQQCGSQSLVPSGKMQLLSLAALTFIFPHKSKTQTHNQRGNVHIMVKTWYTFRGELVTAKHIKIRLNVLKWNIKSLLAHCRQKTDTTEKNLYSEIRQRSCADFQENICYLLPDIVGEVFCFHDTSIPFSHFHHRSSRWKKWIYVLM